MVYMISGKAGAGKDTAFALIKELLPSVERFAFADSLKETAKSLGWDGEKDEKGRKFLQNLGNTVRDYGEDIWANIVAGKILQCTSQTQVITDWRFPNEFEVISGLFSPVVTINIVGRAYDLGNNGNDISEHALEGFKFDYVIDNSGTIAEFRQKLLGVI